MEEIELSLLSQKHELIILLYKLIENNNFYEDGTIYLQVSRGVQARTYTFSYDVPPTIYAYITKKRKDQRYGLNMVYVLYQEPDTRWLRCDIKSLNLLPTYVAATKAERKGCKEALFVRNGTVTEESYSNFFS